MERKSMNKLWKDSGTTLSFKEFCDRENKKRESAEESGNFLTFIANTNNPTDIIEATIDTAKAESADLTKLGKRTVANPNNVLGLNKNILIFSSIIIAGALGFYLYKKYKK